MTEKWTAMRTTRENKDRIMNECVAEYLRHHPEMAEVPISEHKILFEMRRYYLNGR